MPNLDIHLFPCLKDNYGVLIRDPDKDVTASIDAPDAEAVETALADKGWRLTHILTTHHHNDHTGGNLALKEATGCTIIGPRGEAARIPGIDRAVGEDDEVSFGQFPITVIETPGHTLGHISYHIPKAGVAFVGDTLFTLGCGRVFEGTYEMMWSSLRKLMRLPPKTRIYCGHEYTLANAKFALIVDPANTLLQRRVVEFEDMRAKGQPTVPTELAAELDTNPFLRAHAASIRERLKLGAAADWKVFAELRERKNKA
jgi:hydroxyacylglutathione hydrolase